MAQALAERQDDAGALIENVIVRGDLSKLTPQERTRYYVEVCKSVGLNPLTKPFEYLTLNGKLTLYALRSCTDQLRAIHKVSVIDLTETERDGVFVVTAKVQNGDGRTDMAKGAVTLGALKGDALANALMKAETKAKRRATLSICGLGFLDETEVETVPADARGAKRTREEISAEANRKRHDLREAVKDIEQIDNLAALDRFEREVLTAEFMASLGMKQYAVEEAFQRRKEELKRAPVEEAEHDPETGEISLGDVEALRDELVELIESADTAERLIQIRDSADFRSIFARLPKAMQNTISRHGKARLESLPTVE